MLETSDRSKHNKHPLQQGEEVQAVEVVLDVALRGWGWSAIVVPVVIIVIVVVTVVVVTIVVVSSALLELLVIFGPTLVHESIVLLVLEIETVVSHTLVLLLLVGVLDWGWLDEVTGTAVVSWWALVVRFGWVCEVWGTHDEREERTSNTDHANATNALGASAKLALSLIKTALLLHHLVHKLGLLLWGGRFNWSSNHNVLVLRLINSWWIGLHL